MVILTERLKLDNSTSYNSSRCITVSIQQGHGEHDVASVSQGTAEERSRLKVNMKRTIGGWSLPGSDLVGGGEDGVLAAGEGGDEQEDDREDEEETDGHEESGAHRV